MSELIIDVRPRGLYRPYSCLAGRASALATEILLTPWVTYTSVIKEWCRAIRLFCWYRAPPLKGLLHYRDLVTLQDRQKLCQSARKYGKNFSPRRWNWKGDRGVWYHRRYLRQGDDLSAWVTQRRSPPKGPKGLWGCHLQVDIWCYYHLLTKVSVSQKIGRREERIRLQRIDTQHEAQKMYLSSCVRRQRGQGGWVGSRATVTRQSGNWLSPVWAVSYRSQYPPKAARPTRVDDAVYHICSVGNFIVCWSLCATLSTLRISISMTVVGPRETRDYIGW